MAPAVPSLAQHPGATEDDVLIPAGEFLMGTEDGTDIERPVHRVHLDAYSIDRTEVSNADYTAFAPNHRRGSGSACENCPVTRVNWLEARAYCKSRGKRLPTEAEWEKAARGPEGWKYSFAPVADKSRGHFGHSIRSGALAVDTLQPNGYGLHHMSGNVWEWVNDWFDPEYYVKSPVKNPRGPEEGFRKVLRGGSWYNESYYVHTGLRFTLVPRTRLGSAGFRCARDAK